MDRIIYTSMTGANAAAQRQSVLAHNLANAGTVASTDKDAFRGKRVTFTAIMDAQTASLDQSNLGGVKVAHISDDPKSISRMQDPGNPSADKDGYVYLSNVNEMSEMVEMMAAARSYQNNVEVVNTARQLMMRTLDIIKS